MDDAANHSKRLPLEKKQGFLWRWWIGQEKRSQIAAQAARHSYTNLHALLSSPIFIDSIRENARYNYFASDQSGWLDQKIKKLCVALAHFQMGHKIEVGDRLDDGHAYYHEFPASGIISNIVTEIAEKIGDDIAYTLFHAAQGYVKNYIEQYDNKRQSYGR